MPARRRWLFLLFVFFILPLLGQDHAGHAPTIPPLQSSIEYARDPTGALGPTEIQTQVFRASADGILNFSFTDDAIWLRIRLQRHPRDTTAYLLTLGAPYIARAELFAATATGFARLGVSGRHIPPRESAYPARVVAFPISFDANGRADLLMRMQTPDLMLVLVEIRPEMEFKDREALSLLLHGLYLGVAGAMILYNLFLYFGLRDRTYLYYTFFGASIALLAFADGGYMRVYAGDALGVYHRKMIPVFIASAGVWGLLFARSFLDVRTWKPLYSRVILVLVSMLAADFLYALLADTPSAQPGVILTLPVVFVNVWVGSHALFRKRRTARLFLPAFSVFLPGLAAFILLAFALIPPSFFAMHGYTIGSAVEMMVLSLALADRINTLRTEREEARQQTLNLLEKTREDLEGRVAARTAELSAANRSLRHTLEENRVLLREVHHRVKNNMQVMLSLLRLRTGDMDRPAEEVLAEARDRIKAMSMIHSRFCESEDLARIEFSHLIRSVTVDLARSFGQDAGGIRFTLAPVELDLDRAVSCGLILNELVTNSLKHAPAASLRVGLRRNDGMVNLQVEDSGQGVPESSGQDGGRSFGLTLVRDLAEKKLHGSFQLSAGAGGKGVRATVLFPHGSGGRGAIGKGKTKRKDMHARRPR